MLTPRYYLVTRFVAVAAVAVMTLAILGRAVVPGGRLVVTTDLVEPSPYVSTPKPAGRAGEPVRAGGRTVVPLTNGPIYFDLLPPSSFDRLTVTARFAAPAANVEFGALTSSRDNRFTVSDGADAAHEPADRWADFLLPDYQPAARERTFGVSLHGGHRLLVYAADEPIVLGFQVQDMNREAGSDEAELHLFRTGETTPFVSSRLSDDGNVSADQRSSGLRTIAVRTENVPPGVYRAEFIAPGDIFIREIRTDRRKLVFDGHLYLGDTVGYSPPPPPLSVLARGRELWAATPHAEGLQTLSVGGEPLVLEEPGRRQTVAMDMSRVYFIRSPKLDVELDSDGVFALAFGDFFAPESAPALSPVEPSTAASAEFDLSALARTAAGAYRVFIDPATPVEIESLEFVFSREPLRFGNVFATFGRFFRPDPPAVYPGPNDRWYDENF